jgi:hypothetical protein
MDKIKKEHPQIEDALFSLNKITLILDQFLNHFVIT